MDILNTVKSVLGSGTGTKQNDLMSVITNLIGSQSGGLNGLVKQFAAKGLGDNISSWIGTGQNLPVSPSQIQDVLGADTIKGIASKLGLDASAVSGQLSNLLPQVVDKLTPGDKIPEGDILSKGMDMLGGLLGKK